MNCNFSLRARTPTKKCLTSVKFYFATRRELQPFVQPSANLKMRIFRSRDTPVIADIYSFLLIDVRIT